MLLNTKCSDSSHPVSRQQRDKCSDSSHPVSRQQRHELLNTKCSDSSHPLSAVRGQQEDGGVEQGQGQNGHNAADDVEQPSPGEGDAEAEAATRSEQLRHHERRVLQDVLQDVLHAQDSPPTVCCRMYCTHRTARRL